MRGALQVFLSLAALTSAAAAGPALVPGTVGLTQKEVPLRNACTKTFTQIKKAKRGDDAAFAAALTHPRITGLDFDPGHKARAEASKKRFEKWLTDLQGKMEVVQKAQQAVFLDAASTPQMKAEAAARIALMIDQGALVIASSEIPPNIRKIPDAVDAYCDMLDDRVEPMRAKAQEARDACNKVITDGKLTDGWFIVVCTPAAAPAAQTQPSK
jgi:hypothetical protein